MIDQRAFNALDDNNKFTVYNDAASMIGFLQGIIKDLSSGKQSYSDTTKGYLSNDNVATTSLPLQSHSSPPSAGSNIPNREFVHLSLPPKDVVVDGIAIGDSITKRINKEQLGETIHVRGYGGARAEDLLWRVKNSRARQVDNVIISVGVNDCLSDNFNAESTSRCIEEIFVIISSNQSISRCVL